jgi:hypothetical protein
VKKHRELQQCRRHFLEIHRELSELQAREKRCQRIDSLKEDCDHLRARISELYDAVEAGGVPGEQPEPTSNSIDS